MSVYQAILRPLLALATCALSATAVAEPQPTGSSPSSSPDAGSQPAEGPSQPAGSPEASGQAAPVRLIVFSIAGNLQGEQKSLPRDLTRALSEEGKRRGMKTSIAEASYADTALLIGCEPSQASCSHAVLDQLGADQAIYGTMAPGQAPGQVTVSFTMIRRQREPESADVVMQAGEKDKIAGEIQRVVPAAFGSPVVPPLGESTGDSPGGQDLASQRATVWALYGTGGVLAGTGMMFWLLAQQRKGDIDDARVQSADDFERLVDFERSAERNAMIGNILVGSGLVAAGVATFLLVRQERAGRMESQNPVTVVPIAESSALGIGLRIQWTP